MAEATVLVTGATGFVGRVLVRRLLDRGVAVRAAVRGPVEAARGVLPPGAEAVAVGSIGPATDWAAALEGVGAVAHLAARVHVMRDTAADPLAEFRAVNTAGTRRLAESAAAAGVRRLVFVSSIKAVVDESRPEPVTDATPPDPHSPYGLSKREAEEALAAVSAATGLETVVLRPPLVYGPGVAGNLRTLMRLCARRVPLPLAGVRNRRSLVGVENLADAVATCLFHPAAANRRFLVDDGQPLSTPDLIRALGAGLGVAPRLLPVPPALLELAARLLGRADALDRVAGSLELDSRGIRETLGWRPPLDAATGLRATAEWFKASSA